MHTRAAQAELEISLRQVWLAIGRARGHADCLGKLVLCDELGHMQEVIYDYQVQLIKGRTLRTRPKAYLKSPPLPDL